MRLKVSREDTFVPDWNNNKKEPADQQIKVHFKYMTSEVEEKYSKMRPTYKGDLENMTSGEQEITMDLESHICDIWDDCVIRVDNIEEKDKSPTVTIAKPRAVREIPGSYGLITEVVAHIKQGFEAQEEKN